MQVRPQGKAGFLADLDTRKAWLHLRKLALQVHRHLAIGQHKQHSSAAAWPPVLVNAVDHSDRSGWGGGGRCRRMSLQCQARRYKPPTASAAALCSLQKRSVSSSCRRCSTASKGAASAKERQCCRCSTASKGTVFANERRCSTRAKGSVCVSPHPPPAAAPPRPPPPAQPRQTALSPRAPPAITDGQASIGHGCGVAALKRRSTLSTPPTVGCLFSRTHLCEQLPRAAGLVCSGEEQRQGLLQGGRHVLVIRGLLRSHTC